MVHLSSSGVRIGSWDLPQSLDNPCISEPVGVCLVQNQWSSGLAATEEENPGVLEFSQKRFRFQGGGRCGWPGSLPARTAHLPWPLPWGWCFCLSLRRMSGSACCWGPACLPDTPSLLTWDLGEPRLHPSAKPGGCSRILACPFLPVGLPCGALRSLGGCGPGMPGQGGSFTPKVWACLFPQGLGGVCGKAWPKRAGLL